MPTYAPAGRIETSDVEELQQVVRPWDVLLRQMSPGRLYTRMDYVQINGILLYREHWTRRILASGATPPGFFFFGGPISSELQTGWCGTNLSPDRLAFGRPASETEFFTPEAEIHVCLLVPEDLMLRYLGEELAARVLPTTHALWFREGYGSQLLRTMERVLDKYLVRRELLAEARLCKAIEWQLLGALLEFLLTGREESARYTRSTRYLVVRRSIELCEGLPDPISVGELAARSGVSQRVLELRFQEIARMTPLRFMRWNRMNHVRRKLLAADGRSASVTHIASSCGIGELGRFAVEYKQLFGESPSATLSRKPVLPPRRFLDLLPDAPDR